MIRKLREGEKRLNIGEELRLVQRELGITESWGSQITESTWKLSGAAPMAG